MLHTTTQFSGISPRFGHDVACLLECIMQVNSSAGQFQVKQTDLQSQSITLRDENETTLSLEIHQIPLQRHFQSYLTRRASIPPQ